ncbi:MAG: hypothetical protein WKF55_12075 [Gemmatimonadaceae bacterium]
MYAKTRNSLAHAFLGPACDPSRPNSLTRAITRGIDYKFAALLLSAAVLSLGCGDSTGPATGAVAVSVSTTGAAVDLDPDGYSLSIDGGTGQAVAVNSAVTLADLPPGNHLVRLDGLAPNCSIQGSNPRSVDVIAGREGRSTVSVSFSVTCIPRSGSMRITITTTGVDLDPNGYHVFLRRTGKVLSSHRTKGPVTFSALALGSWELIFYDVAANCDVVMPNPRTFTISEADPLAVAVDIVCEAPRLLAFVHGEGLNAEIHVVNSNGIGGRQLTVNGVEDLDPAWSPDGRRIAFTSARDGNHEIYIMNADGTSPARLTNVPASDSRPSWSPDGTRVTFATMRDGNSEIYVMNADGTNPVRLTSNDAFDGDPTWSPDGRRIAFRSQREGIRAIWLMDEDGSRPMRITSPISVDDRQPAWSPDGTRIAFSRGGGIVIMNADGSGLISPRSLAEEEEDPSWAPNGRKIAISTNSFYYGRELDVINLQGTPFSRVTSLQPVSNPVWQP